MLGAGLALAACGSQAGSSQTTASTTAAATTTTVTTTVSTVVGTTPDGATVTETDTELTTTPAGPDGVALEPGPQLATTSTTAQGQTIDSIQCSAEQQLAYQANAHLQIYVRGRPRALPATIGLIGAYPTKTGTTTTYAQGRCAYWLQTEAGNGVIEIRSPVPWTYTLGELFDIWGQPLSARQVASARGTVTATVNGKVWHGNPRAIPLREHESIQLAVGRPVPRFKAIDWARTDL